jgi:hypothetical protein
MACERYQDALSDVAVGASAPAELEAHLAACAACRAELDALRQVLAVVDGELQRALASNPSPDLVARIRSAVAVSEDAPSRRLALAWRPLLAAAAVLAIGLAVVVRTERRGEPVTVASSASPGEPARPPRVADGAPAVTPTATPTRAANATPAAGHTEPLPIRPAPAVRRSEPAAAEVLVPAGEADALLRFVALVHQQRVAAPPVLASANVPATDLLEPPAIEIRPLEIVPLDPAETSGT